MYREIIPIHPNQYGIEKDGKFYCVELTLSKDPNKALSTVYKAVIVEIDQNDHETFINEVKNNVSMYKYFQDEGYDGIMSTLKELAKKVKEATTIDFWDDFRKIGECIKEKTFT
jgi:hypothetical protein